MGGGSRSWAMPAIDRVLVPAAARYRVRRTERRTPRAGHRRLPRTTALISDVAASLNRPPRQAGTARRPSSSSPKWWGLSDLGQMDGRLVSNTGPRSAPSRLGT